MKDKILNRIKALQEEGNHILDAKQKAQQAIRDMEHRMAQISGAIVELNSLLPVDKEPTHEL